MRALRGLWGKGYCMLSHFHSVPGTCPCHGLVDSVTWALYDKSEEDQMEKNHQGDQVEGGIDKEDGMDVSGFGGQHEYSIRLDVGSYQVGWEEDEALPAGWIRRRMRQGRMGKLNFF